MLEALSSAVLTLAKALCVVALLLLFLGLDVGKRWRLRHIPGPPASPFLGNLPQLLRLGSPTFFRQCREKYGPVFRVAFGRNWSVVVAEPDLLRQVGSRTLNHALFRSLLRGELRQLDDLGLVIARDDYWRLVRNAWQPAFSAGSLSGYLPRMIGCADQLAGRLEARAARAEAGGEEAAYVDIWRELGSMTLQVVGSTAYGVDFHAMDERDGNSTSSAADGGATAAAEVGSSGRRGQQYGSMLVEACRDVFRYSSLLYGTKYSRVSLLLPELRPLVSTVAHLLPDRPFAKLLRARKDLRDVCFDLIGAWKARPTPAPQPRAGGSTADASEAPAANGDGVTSGTAPTAPAVAVGSFLGLILSARDKASGEGLTDLQVAAQVQTFILAGYETTANGLAFAVYCIATNPAVEARLLEEVDSVLGPDRLPTEADLPRLPYTEAVFNEALRLYPPAHATNRTEEAPLQVGGYTIPANTPVFMSIYSSHHNPDVWPRVGEFIPERFLQSSPLHTEVCARGPNAHAPFGYGSRMCIGWKFAVQEAKVALARLYQRLRFELQPGQVPLRTSVGITLAPRDGLWVRPVLRNRPPVACVTTAAART